MAQVARYILLSVFLFQAPILFYLKHRLKWQIHHALLGTFCLLLGWFTLLCLGYVGGPHGPDEGYPMEIVLLILLMAGWQISAVVLVFWSPVIVFVSVKNKKIKLAMSVIFLTVVSLIGIVHFSSRFERGVPGNRLIHEGSTRAGFDDHTFTWVFEAENDLLKKKMIRKWDLRPMTAYPDRSHPISFAAVDKDKPEWWPSEEMLESLEGYGFVRNSNGFYRSLWYDPNNQRLYLERGNW